MKVLNKIVKEAKYYAVPEEDDLDGQTEAILNMPAVQPVDVDIDDELGVIDDIESRYANLGSAYGDEVIDDEEEVVGEDGDEEDVYEITTESPVCPCCGCKLVITDLPSEAEEEVEVDDDDEEYEDEDEIEIVDDDDEESEDEDEIEIVDDDDEESEDEDEIEIVDDDEESEDDED